MAGDTKINVLGAFNKNAPSFKLFSVMWRIAGVTAVQTCFKLRSQFKGFIMERYVGVTSRRFASFKQLEDALADAFP